MAQERQPQFCSPLKILVTAAVTTPAQQQYQRTKSTNENTISNSSNNTSSATVPEKFHRNYEHQYQ
jgi:hypothetical protein